MSVQFEMSFPAVSSSQFVYESCSADYDLTPVVCSAGGNQLQMGEAARHLTACFFKPTFPGVPVVKVSGKVTHQAALFAALVTPVPAEPTASATEHVTPPPADSSTPPPPTDSSTPPSTDSSTLPPAEAAPGPPEPVLSLEEIRHEMKLHRQAYIRLCLPLFSAHSLPILLPAFTSQAEKREFVRRRLGELSAAKKELEGVGRFRAWLSKLVSRG